MKFRRSWESKIRRNRVWLLAGPSSGLQPVSAGLLGLAPDRAVLIRIAHSNLRIKAPYACSVQAAVSLCQPNSRIRSATLWTCTEFIRVPDRG
jgi:hypothetical protein